MSKTICDNITCPLFRAPGNCLAIIYRLRNIRHLKPEVTTAALETLERHLHYLSSDLVEFGLFDDELDDEERQLMAQQLLNFREQWVPGEMLIDQVPIILRPIKVNTHF